MIKKLFVASNNPDKLKEIKDIFLKNDLNIEILCPNDFNDDSDVDEDGFSFKENALLKANFYFNKYHYPTIADDSGIEIDYLNNLPSIHSKRFLNTEDYILKNNIILDIMKDIKNRKATFYNCIAYIDENIEKTFVGTNVGEISHIQKGNEGFGYDPIFLIPDLNKTEAELGSTYKNIYSHRAKALKLFIDYVKE